MKSKLVALGIGIAYAAGCGLLPVEPGSAVNYLIATFVAECLIWFPEQAGAITGMGAHDGHRGVDTETPGCMVTLFGWLMLVGIPIVHVGL